ncbi:hypothetical protein FA048_09610 [Pedobacter polaris]|uniref:C1q domain-containing protein n=1 Tax=Pedobacter polaris TaxID=2571273 RepID=A0A4U1CSE9_9SPHI|nr:hypothetical protein [Pedobacter polaris]TKC10436.1 hypothetical protein FA048_09610 [Pedobacter polaris]
MRLLLIVMLILLKNISFAQNTGIGTLTPTAKLDVNGNLRIRSIASTTDATLYNTLLSDNNGNVLNVKTTDFVEALKVPVNIFNAQQNTDLTTSLSGNNTLNQTVFSTVNFIKTSAGTWDATTNTFTVTKKGVYQIVTGTLLNEVEAGSYVISIKAGPSSAMNTLTVGGIILSGNRYTMNGTYVVQLEANDLIYIQTSTGNSTAYSQGKAFLHIIFTPL